MSEKLEAASSVTLPTSDERLWAALAHGSALLSFFGPIAPALIWVFQRRKSPYVAFHALQAMGYQMLTFWVGMAVYLLFVIVMMFIMFPVISALAQSDNPLAGIFAFEGSFFLFMFGFMGLYFLVGIIGALMSLMGRDFKVPFLGTRLARYLGRGEDPFSPLDESKAEQWAAGVCHGSAILILWGMFTPLVVWLAEKDKSSRLRFQSMQAFVYQLLATVAYFVLMFLYMFVFFGFFAAMIFLSPQVSQETSFIFIIVLLVMLLVFFLFMLVFALAVPTYHLFAMIAGIQVVRGKDYRYPLFGNFLARRFGNGTKGE